MNATTPESWNSIAAYISLESDRKRLREIVARLKRSVGVPTNVEVKLKNLSESQYFEFLGRIGQLDGALYAVATDAGLNQQREIAEHQKVQAERIIEHKDKMHHQLAREGLQALSEQVAAFAPQLYIQLHCQVNLIATIILSGVLYFVQRRPKSLGRFRWRIDQKNSIQTEYEKAFVSVTPAFLQTISLREPMPMLIGADYSAFSRFEYSEEDRPTYLRETYGIGINVDKPATNIGMLMREDLDFVDSKHDKGVQVADLLASGVRRCLRQQFGDNELAARLLGRLMVQNYRDHPPIQFLGFSRSEARVSEGVARLSRIMERNSRAMLVR